MSESVASPAEAQDLPAELATLAQISADLVLSHDGSGAPCVDVPLDVWQQIAAQLHAEGYLFFDWLSAVDEPEADPAGVDVVYHVQKPTSRGVEGRVLVRTRVPNSDGTIATLSGVWPGAAWHERETFEMFGIDFEGFAEATGEELRPLLLPDGFEGTPLRKSFVLTARASKPWPGAKEPGESEAKPARAAGRRRTTAPGIPDPSWGPATAAERDAAAREAAEAAVAEAATDPAPNAPDAAGQE